MHFTFGCPFFAGVEFNSVLQQAICNLPFREITFVNDQVVFFCFSTRTRLQRHAGLACLEIRSRNEAATNSTRNLIYSLMVFYFLLYRRRYFYLCRYPNSLRRRRSKPSVYSVCELVHNIVFESRRVAKKYVDLIDWLFSFAVCDQSDLS